MKKVLIVAALLAAPLMYAQGISIGIHLGAPPPMRVVRVPVSPGPNYSLIDGYWYPVNGRYVWHDPYYTRSPYVGAAWAAPRYEGGSYYQGYWKTDRGDYGHNHSWDHGHNRDYNKGKNWNKGNGHDNGHDH